ncbi:hypothetical protein D3C71_1583590 [compost metagenome]
MKHAGDGGPLAAEMIGQILLDHTLVLMLKNVAHHLSLLSIQSQLRQSVVGHVLDLHSDGADRIRVWGMRIKCCHRASDSLSILRILTIWKS